MMGNGIMSEDAWIGKYALPEKQDLPLQSRFGYNFSDWVTDIF